MTDSDTSTSATGSPDDAASASADAGDGQDTTSGQAGVSVNKEQYDLLDSRFKGQTAKVNELSNANKTLEQQLREANAELEKARKGEVDKDAAAQALLAAKDQEIEGMRRQARQDVISARFPEAFAELGEAALSLTDDKLAAIEVRLQGGSSSGEEQEPPTPRGQNAARGDGARGEPKEETFDDMVARLAKTDVPEHWGGRG